jgi:hypothetical protein
MDPDWFNTDLDPDPTFQLNPDLDPHKILESGSIAEPDPLSTFLF